MTPALRLSYRPMPGCLAGRAGIRVTYLAMAGSAAVIAIAVGPLLIRRAASLSR